MAQKLTDKQKLFVEHYLQCWNATKAAELAGYAGSYATLRSVGSENLTKPNIKAEIDRRFKEVVMASDEVLARLSYLARGFDPTEYMELIETYAVDSDGEAYVSGLQVKLDLERLRNDGYGRLIKGIRNTSNGPHFEFYGVEKPLELIGTNEGLFRRQVEHTGKDGGPIEHQTMTLDEWRALRQERLDAIGDTPEGKKRKS